jgi:hypothetical protein
MLQAIIKGDINSISAKLELKLDEFPCVPTERLYYTVPYASYFVFLNESIPKSNSPKIYSVTKQYKQLFTKLGCILDEHELALSSTRRILINKTSLSLLMLIYNNDFRDFCSVTETKKEILATVKEQLDKHIKY